MVSMTRTNKRTGSNGRSAVSGDGAPSRTRSVGPDGAGTDPNAPTGGASEATEASLTQMRERRIAEVRLGGSE